jgi:hypothetical protein
MRHDKKDARPGPGPKRPQRMGERTEGTDGMDGEHPRRSAKGQAPLSGTLG